MRALLLLVLMIPLLCFARGAQAQIHRCTGARGEPVFTDQPCGAAELAVNPSSSKLDSNDQTDIPDTAADSGGTLIAATCPHSPEQVRDRIRIAFNDDNPNALAGLFDWRGFSHRSADAQLEEFGRWLKHPLVDVQFSGAMDPSGAQPDDLDYAPQNPSGLTVLTQSARDTTPDARSFGMTESGGCWWLSF
ncbi:MAG TPA: DUF4124 domain-containing protein [Rhodanobacteraceae bacterium]|nr:DUF4124 domain-containing protein [Rhodanobacteraceae bacterium]